MRFLLRRVACRRLVPPPTTVRGSIGLPRRRRQRHPGTAQRQTQPRQPQYANSPSLELYLFVPHSDPGALRRRCRIIQRVVHCRKILQSFKPDSTRLPRRPSSREVNALPGQPCLIRTTLLPRQHHPSIQLPHRPIQLRDLLRQARRQHHRSGRFPSRAGWLPSCAMAEARGNRSASGRHSRRHRRERQGNIPGQHGGRERAEKLRGSTGSVPSRVLG